MANNTLAENLIRLQEVKEDIADAIVEMGGTASSTDGLEDMPDAIRTIQANPTLITKSITANGTYNASSDNADGYSEVTVAVPNSYSAVDEGKVVSNGALVAQGSDSVTENGVVDTTLISSLTVDVPTATFEACELIKSSGLGGEVYGINTEDRTIVAGLLYNAGSYSSIVLTFPQGFTPRYTKAAYGIMSAYYDYGYNSSKSITSINITNSSITIELAGFSYSSQKKQVPICMQFSTN